MIATCARGKQWNQGRLTLGRQDALEHLVTSGEELGRMGDSIRSFIQPSRGVEGGMRMSDRVLAGRLV